MRKGMQKNLHFALYKFSFSFCEFKNIQVHANKIYLKLTGLTYNA